MSKINSSSRIARSIYLFITLVITSCSSINLNLPQMPMIPQKSTPAPTNSLPSQAFIATSTPTQPPVPTATPIILPQVQAIEPIVYGRGQTIVEIFCTIHGNEINTHGWCQELTRMINPNDPSFTFIIVPVTNPVGYANNTRGKYQIDLNRNFDSGNEPEVVDIKNLITSQNPAITFFMHGATAENGNPGTIRGCYFTSSVGDNLNLPNNFNFHLCPPTTQNTAGDWANLSGYPTIEWELDGDPWDEHGYSLETFQSFFEIIHYLESEATP